MIDHVLSWAAVAAPRFELVEVTMHLGTLSARGTMLAGGGDPYRVDYHLDTGPGYVTKRLVVFASGRGWSRQLRIGRDAEGTWMVRRTAEPPDDTVIATPEVLAGALDCDLRYSPLFNTLPVLRSRLHAGAGRVEAPSALVTLPELGLVRYEQRYEHLRRLPGGALVAHRAGQLRADVTFGDDGFVTRYPGIAERVGPPVAAALAAS